MLLHRDLLTAAEIVVDGRSHRTNSDQQHGGSGKRRDCHPQSGPQPRDAQRRTRRGLRFGGASNRGELHLASCTIGKVSFETIAILLSERAIVVRGERLGIGAFGRGGSRRERRGVPQERVEWLGIVIVAFQRGFLLLGTSDRLKIAMRTLIHCVTHRVSGSARARSSCKSLAAKS